MDSLIMDGEGMPHKKDIFCLSVGVQETAKL